MSLFKAKRKKKKQPGVRQQVWEENARMAVNSFFPGL